MLAMRRSARARTAQPIVCDIGPICKSVALGIMQGLWGEGSYAQMAIHGCLQAGIEYSTYRKNVYYYYKKMKASGADFTLLEPAFKSIASPSANNIEHTPLSILSAAVASIDARDSIIGQSRPLYKAHTYCYSLIYSQILETI